MADHPRYTSVTALTGLLPKNLTWWAGNAVARCAFEEQEQWKHLPTREERYEYVRRAHDRIKSSAADIGTEIHGFIEARNLGKPEPVYPLPAKARMRHFADFVERTGMIVEAAETKVYHRGDRGGMSAGCRYAGTLDIIGTLPEVDGRMAVIDIKTGKSVWPEAALQINGYAFADFLVADPHHPGAKQITPKRGKRWYEWHGSHADEIEMPGIDAGYVLHLRDDGWDLIEVPILESLYEVMLALFPVDRWERETKKGVLTRVMGSVMDEDALAAQSEADHLAAVAEFGGVA